MRMYELTEMYKDLQAAIENEEVTEEEAADTFDAIKDAMTVKIDALSAIYLEAQGDEVKIDTEIERLKKLKARAGRTKERVTNIAANFLTAMGKDNAKGDQFTFKRRKFPPRVVVADEKLLPKEYIKEKVLTSIDKIAIKKALQNGDEVAGASLEQRHGVVFE
ncbi:siphovirus Gp157 family protein [Negativicoccus succinicivorans]